MAFPAVVLAVAAAVVGCSGSSGPAPSPSVRHSSAPVDAASPADTSTPTPTEPDYLTPTLTPTPIAVLSGAAGAAPDDNATPGLAACLAGNWSAPVSREFTALGFSKWSKGIVRAGGGVLQLRYGRDRTYTLTYDDVTLSLPAGQAEVNGPVSGTWSLAGSTLRSVLIKSTAKVTVSLGGVTVGAPAGLASAVQSLPPAETSLTCSSDRLLMKMPAGSGGGTVTFDRA